MKQSIVTWHPWPENGVEGLPKDKPMMLLGGDGETWGGMVIWDGLSLEWYAEWSACMSIEHESFGIIDGLDTPTHYALASDLETVHEIDPTANPSPINPNLGLKSDEDRVRWLVEQAVVISASQPDMSCLNAMEYVIGLASEARAQVERERKEGGHE